MIALTTLLFLILCHNVGFASKVVSWAYCCCSTVCSFCTVAWTCSGSWTATSCISWTSSCTGSLISIGVGIVFNASATSIPI